MVCQIIWANKALTVTKLTVCSEALPESFSGFRIVHVSDLHNTEFGAENEELLRLIESQSPDLIAVTGDIIDSRRTDVGIALKFAEKAAEIAPVYYVPGNHESRVPKEYTRLTDGLRTSGVTVLEDAAAVLEREGEKLCLAGLTDYAFYGRFTKEEGIENTRKRLSSLLKEREEYTVLLSHRPQLFPAYAACKINLTLCGHLHGGQIRLPLIGGLASVGQPESGLYTEDDVQIVISRGLGNSLFPFRVNNRPEIVVVELQKGE
ncbi:MAG: metallophosphoesterase [Oscillospiraceae bacterium]|nr:metallophosphoesterase [Oscillospiraceae bacterium]